MPAFKTDNMLQYYVGTFLPQSLTSGRLIDWQHMNFQQNEWIITLFLF